MELHHLETTFVEINNFPRNVVERIFKLVRTEMNVVSNSATNNATEKNAVEHKVSQCTLPYAGEKREFIVKEVNKEFKKLKRHNLKTRFAFKAKRLSSCSNLNDPIKKEHLHNVVYEIEYPDCDKKYIGETGRRTESGIRTFRHHISKFESRK